MYYLVKEGRNFLIYSPTRGLNQPRYDSVLRLVQDTMDKLHLLEQLLHDHLFVV